MSPLATLARFHELTCGRVVTWDSQGSTLRRMTKLIVLSVLVYMYCPFASAQTDLDRRMSVMESVRADVRLTAIEARLETFKEDTNRRLDAVEKVGYGILITVVGHLLISGASLKMRRS